MQRHRALGKQAWRSITASLAAVHVIACSPETMSDLQSGLGTIVNEYVPQSLQGISKGVVGALPDVDTSIDRERQLAGELSTMTERRNRLSKDEDLAFYVAGVQANLVAVLDEVPYTFSIRVLESDDLNAFTTGAGNNYITSGLLAALRNEAELAMVIGHEMSHSLERHVVKGIRTSSAVGALSDVSADYFNSSGAATAVPRTLRQQAFEYTSSAMRNGFSRSDERDADRIGLGLMVAAGYAPGAGADVYEMLAGVAGQRSRIENFFHGAHPLASVRAAYLRTLIEEHYGDAPAPLGYGDAPYLMATASLR